MQYILGHYPRIVQQAPIRDTLYGHVPIANILGGARADVYGAEYGRATANVPEMCKGHGIGHLAGNKMADVTEAQRHRQLYDRYCRQKFHDGGRGCSKTVSSKKREKIIRYLSNKEGPDVSPHFRFWVKNRGFQLVQIGGNTILCLPNKQRVSSILALVWFESRAGWTNKPTGQCNNRT